MAVSSWTLGQSIFYVAFLLSLLANLVLWVEHYVLKRRCDHLSNQYRRATGREPDGPR